MELCFSYKGKRKYFSTGIKVTPNQWSDNTKKVIKRKDSNELNALLEAYRSRACDIIEKLVKKGNCELDTAISMMKGEDETCVSFIEYCEKRRNERKVCEHTKKRYDVFIGF